MLTKKLLIKQLRAGNQKLEAKIKSVKIHLTAYPESHSDWQEGRFKTWAEQLHKILEAEG